MCVWPSVDGPRMYCVIQGIYTDKGVGSVCMAIHDDGWTRDVTVTMPSRDTQSLSLIPRPTASTCIGILFDLGRVCMVVHG